MVPRFSVVIPVYNRAKSVGPTLESVRDQTFRDFECIVVDDGSADGEELHGAVEALHDPRFRYVRRENGGGGAARNTGIDEAKGEFIAFLDSDDRWLPEKLARDADACAENGVVFSPVLVERDGSIVGRRPRRAPHKTEPIGDYLARGQGFIPTSTIALPLQLARAVRFDETINFGQDADFAIRLDASGVEFHMIKSSVIMLDDETGDRVSRSIDWQTALAWADRVRPLISDRAYQALLGWHVARLAAHSAHYGTALGMYFGALVRGALPPRLAAKALGQILLPRSAYKRLARP
jgi:glycosyltransferase involved in cell wall biosynthesis